MKIEDYIDPYNIEHINAVYELEKTGKWPKDFYEKIKDCEFSSFWQFSIFRKIALEWIKYKLMLHRNLDEDVKKYYED